MLDIHDLTFGYPGHAVLDAACVRLDAGRVYGLVGPNGAGKTTLFSLLKQHLEPDRGTIRWQCPPDAVGLLTQEFAAFTRLRTAECFDLLALLNARRRALGWVELLAALPPRQRQRAGALATRELWKLSTGERRWLYVEWLLATPTLRAALLDEPTAGVDPEFRALIHARVRAFVGDGRTVVIATHLLDELAGLDAVILALRCHRIEAHATLEAFRTSFAARTADEAFTRAFGDDDAAVA